MNFTAFHKRTVASLNVNYTVPEMECCRHAQLCLRPILICHNKNNSNNKKPHQHTFNYPLLMKPGFQAMFPSRK